MDHCGTRVLLGKIQLFVTSLDFCFQYFSFISFALLLFLLTTLLFRFDFSSSFVTRKAKRSIFGAV